VLSADALECAQQPLEERPVARDPPLQAGPVPVLLTVQRVANQASMLQPTQCNVPQRALIVLHGWGADSAVRGTDNSARATDSAAWRRLSSHLARDRVEPCLCRRLVEADKRLAAQIRARRSSVAVVPFPLPLSVSLPFPLPLSVSLPFPLPLSVSFGARGASGAVWRVG
jgi:hypothetical protein